MYNTDVDLPFSFRKQQIAFKQKMFQTSRRGNSTFLLDRENNMMPGILVSRATALINPLIAVLQKSEAEKDATSFSLLPLLRYNSPAKSLERA